MIDELKELALADKRTFSNYLAKVLTDHVAEQSARKAAAVIAAESARRGTVSDASGAKIARKPRG